MDITDVHEMCDHYGIDRDDTMFVLYKRGEYDIDRTLDKKLHNTLPETSTHLSDESHFSDKTESHY